MICKPIWKHPCFFLYHLHNAQVTETVDRFDDGYLEFSTFYKYWIFLSIKKNTLQCRNYCYLLPLSLSKFIFHTRIGTCWQQYSWHGFCFSQYANGHYWAVAKMARIFASLNFNKQQHRHGKSSHNMPQTSKEIKKVLIA